MNMMQNPPPAAQSDVDAGLAVPPLEILKFAVEAARRNLFTCFASGLLTLLVGLAVVSSLPRVFESTAKIHATSVTSITTELTRGHTPGTGGVVVKDVNEAVFNHTNLEGLVAEAKLVENWPRTRNWAQRMIDRVRLLVRGPTSHADMEKVLLPLLEGNIDVVPEDSSSIRFRARWRDPATAQVLTGLIQERYIASKEEEEVVAIQRAVTVLEEQRKHADDGFGPAVADLRAQIQKLQKEAKAKALEGARAKVPTPGQVITVPAAPTAPPPELISKLDGLRAEERAVIEPWQRRMAELKFQLADLRAVYGPSHPNVVQVETKLMAASAEPVELLEIRQRQEELKGSLAHWGITGLTRTTRSASGGRSADNPEGMRELIGSAADDPRLAPVRLQLESVILRSRELSARLDAARMELALTRAAFKYRYRQVEPASYWVTPIKPKVPMLTGIVVALALIVGFLAGAGRDLLSGTLMENWQARQLGIEVIATVDVSSWDDPPRSSRSSLPPPLPPR